MSPTLPSSQSTPASASSSRPPRDAQHTPHHALNFHPYQIRTTASSLLTRSNSSPTQPLDAVGRHRPSRSMSSLSSISAGSAGSESEGAGAGGGAGGGAGEGGKSEDRRRSAGEGIKRSRPVPAFLAERGAKQAAEPSLPLNPKDWSPSELALYLAHVLRTGGPDGSGPTLPQPVVQDIKTWVIRSQVTGRTFLRGSPESWGSGRPPPFLPVLQSLSRRLRRLSLGARPVPNTSAILHEADEGADDGLGGLRSDGDGDGDGFGDDDDDADVSRVRQLAHVFDAIHASESDGDLRLRAQHTGASSRSSRSGRSSSGRSSLGSDAGAVPRADDDVATPRRAGVPARGGRASGLGAGRVADESPAASPGLDDDDADVVVTPNSDADPLATLKSPVRAVGSSGGGGGSVGGARLAHLYDAHGGADDSPLAHKDKGALALALAAAAGAERTPSRPPLATLVPPAAATPGSPPSPHMARMDSHASAGANSYGALRTASGRVPTLSTPAAPQSSDDGDDDDAAAARAQTTPYASARRAAPRPPRADAVFDPAAGVGGGSPGTASPRRAARRTARERELEAQVGALLSRVRELEDRLDRVEDGAGGGGGDGGGGGAGARDVGGVGKAPADGAWRGVWRILGAPAGAGAADDDALPRRVRELPAYLLLVGVGVGAVLARVLIARMARA